MVMFIYNPPPLTTRTTRPEARRVLADLRRRSMMVASIATSLGMTMADGRRS